MSQELSNIVAQPWHRVGIQLTNLEYRKLIKIIPVGITHIFLNIEQ